MAPSKEQLLVWLDRIKSNAHQCGFDPVPNYHKDFYLGYYEHVLPLVISEAIFDPARKRMAWHEYNSRTPWSILGTVEEQYQIIKFNNNSSTSKMYRSDGGKEAEMKGEDSCVYNPKWPRPYSIQSKHGVSEEPFGLLTIHADWLKYPETLDRFCVSNHSKDWAIMMGYPEFKKFVTSTYPRLGNIGSEYYEVPVIDLKRKQELRLMKF